MSSNSRTIAVDISTCTVNGSSYSKPSAAWDGLDLNLAEVREQSTLMLAITGKDAPPDHHLDVPWMHPEDRPKMADDPDAWCFYRVRPRYRYRRFRFVKIAGQWFLAKRSIEGSAAS
jgi:hypothetical protein